MVSFVIFCSLELANNHLLPHGVLSTCQVWSCTHFRTTPSKFVEVNAEVMISKMTHASLLLYDSQHFILFFLTGVQCVLCGKATEVRKTRGDHCGSPAVCWLLLWVALFSLHCFKRRLGSLWVQEILCAKTGEDLPLPAKPLMNLPWFIRVWGHS